MIGKAHNDQMSLVTESIDHGQRIRELKLRGEALEGKMTGEWRRRDGKSSAKLAFDVRSRDPANVLRAVGYTPNLEAKGARAQGELSWDPATKGIDWQLARGKVALGFEDGQLRAVEP